MSQTEWRFRRHVAAARVSQRPSPSSRPAWRNPPQTSGGMGTATARTTRATSRRARSTSPTSLSFRSRGPTLTAKPGSSPIVARGAIYGRGRNGSIVAVDAKTGKELWVRENMNGMSSRGMMYWESRDGRDQRLIFPMNSLFSSWTRRPGNRSCRSASTAPST